MHEAVVRVGTGEEVALAGDDHELGSPSRVVRACRHLEEVLPRRDVLAGGRGQNHEERTVQDGSRAVAETSRRSRWHRPNLPHGGKTRDVVEAATTLVTRTVSMYVRSARAKPLGVE